MVNTGRALFSIVVGFGGMAALFFQGVPYSLVGRLSGAAVLAGHGHLDTGADQRIRGGSLALGKYGRPGG